MVTHDIKKYPNTRIFVIHRACGEIFDYDFAMEHRDHKLLRTAFSFGGMAPNVAGVAITEKCVACGKCFAVCSFKAIKPGEKYSVIEERCDECGDCFVACPVEAILTRGEKVKC